MSRATEEGPNGNQPDDGDCVVCGDPADGIDARTRDPMCRRCASIRCDGDVSCFYCDLETEGAHPTCDRPDCNNLTHGYGQERKRVLSNCPRHRSDVDRGDGPVTDGGRGLYTCDTPTCDGEKEVTTPDGYVCRDCADELAAKYEEVDRRERTATDGGVLEGAKYHAVCSDCTFEELEDDRHRAAQRVDEHETDEPSHDVRFEEVSGR